MLLYSFFYRCCWYLLLSSKYQQIFKVPLKKKTSKTEDCRGQECPQYQRIHRRAKIYIILRPCSLAALFFFLSLVANKTNHHSVSKGGLNVTAPSHKKTAARISMREMKSSQKKGHTEAPVSVEISANLSPFTLFVRKIRSECKPGTKGLCLKSIEKSEGA